MFGNWAQTYVLLEAMGTQADLGPLVCMTYLGAVCQSLGLAIEEGNHLKEDGEAEGTASTTGWEVVLFLLFY